MIVRLPGNARMMAARPGPYAEFTALLCSALLYSED